MWVAFLLNEVLPLTSVTRVCEDLFHLVELFLLVRVYFCVLVERGVGVCFLQKRDMEYRVYSYGIRELEFVINWSLSRLDFK